MSTAKSLFATKFSFRLRHRKMNAQSSLRREVEVLFQAILLNGNRKSL